MGARKGTAFTLLICALIVVPSGLASATAIPATAHMVEVVATSGGHTATFEQVFSVSSFDGLLGWSLPAPLTLSDGSHPVATINSMTVGFDADPQVDLGFAISNPNLGNPVSIQITSATIVFGAAPNAQAEAAASLTLTQGAGSPAGGSVTGLFPGGKAYQARYSTHPIINTGTVFSSLVQSLAFVSGLGTSASDSAGPINLNATCYMIESQFHFTLSAGDQASGTSAFIVTPEPSTALLLVLGGLLRRRCRTTA